MSAFDRKDQAFIVTLTPAEVEAILSALTLLLAGDYGDAGYTDETTFEPIAAGAESAKTKLNRIVNGLAKVIRQTDHGGPS
jgi:hypothetical protein